MLKNSLLTASKKDSRALETYKMALVQTNVCDTFDRISQREVLARILAEDVPPEDHWSSDSEHDTEEQGKNLSFTLNKPPKFPLHNFKNNLYDIYHSQVRKITRNLEQNSCNVRFVIY